MKDFFFRKDLFTNITASVPFLEPVVPAEEGEAKDFLGTSRSCKIFVTPTDDH